MKILLRILRFVDNEDCVKFYIHGALYNVALMYNDTLNTAA